MRGIFVGSLGVDMRHFSSKACWHCTSGTLLHTPRQQCSTWPLYCIEREEGCILLLHECRLPLLKCLTSVSCRLASACLEHKGTTLVRKHPYTPLLEYDITQGQDKRRFDDSAARSSAAEASNSNHPSGAPVPRLARGLPRASPHQLVSISNSL